MLLFILPLGACSLQHETTPTHFVFGAWGDSPYQKNHDMERISGLIDDINHSELAFSIFDGDIKDGSSLCSDEIYLAALKRFNQLRSPLFYIPGDNEWTDCHRTSNGAYDPQERLAFLRQLFFSSPNSLGQQPMALLHQAEPGQPYSENIRWEYGGILFAGINVPGSNNNQNIDIPLCMQTTQRTAAMCEQAHQEFLAREKADIAWLNASFDQARLKNMKGLVIIIHGDPGFDRPETDTVNERDLPQYSGFTRFLKVMGEETSRFKGEVLLIHGDSHYFIVDKPLYEPRHLLRNFTRLETFGSPNLHWVKVSVDPDSWQLFHFEPMLTDGITRAPMATAP